MTGFGRHPLHPRRGLRSASLALVLLAAVQADLQAQEGQAAPQDPSVIEVAVFYTPAARVRYSSAAQVRAHVDVMVRATNYALEESGADVEFSLAGLEEVFYREQGSISTDLLNLYGSDDGYMDGIHATRDRLEADVVVLITGRRDSCGTSWTLADRDADPRPWFGFSVVAEDCGATAFAHELGHLLGLGHDRFHVRFYEDGGTYPDSYSFGYVNQEAFSRSSPESSRWRTLMAYPLQCLHSGFFCTQILRFSNPEQTYLSDPLGVAAGEEVNGWGPADAVRRINETRRTVESHRGRPADAPAISASIAASFSPVTEGTAASFTVSLDRAAPEALTLPVSVTETGSMLAGVPPASVTVPPGLRKVTLSVPTEQDTVVEFASTVTAALTDGPAYASGPSASASVTVQDDDGAASTPAGPPPQMASPSVQEDGYFALSVSWSEPDARGPPITGYDLQYRKSGAAAWTDGPQDRAATSAVIGDLDSDTNYQVRVRARNAAFDGPWSEPAEAATAMWIAVLTVGAYDSQPRGRWGFMLDPTRRFGKLAPRVLTYNGVDYQVRILAWTRENRRIGGEIHHSALDIFMVGSAIPDEWGLRVNGRRYRTSEGVRGNPDEDVNIIVWPDPDLSLDLDEDYEVVFYREPSAPKDENYDPAAPLTAEFERLPNAHNGSSPFRFRLQFSEEIRTNSDDFRNGVLEVTGGSVESARQLSPPSRASWEITVRPSGPGSVSVVLPGNRNCATAGAVCTPLGKQLSGRIAAAVPGPAATLLPGATIVAASSTVTEGTVAAFTVTLPAPAAAALTLPVSVTETGSMLSGAPPVSVSFAQGDTAATLGVPTTDDSAVEADSTVTATLPTGSGRSVSASATVRDDDTATFAVSTGPGSIDEGGFATLTVAISNGVTFAQDQTVTLTRSGTAAAADYTGVPPALVIPAGASSATATLAAVLDDEEEEAETVTVTASHGGSPIGSATVTIQSYSHDATLNALSLPGIDIGTFAAGSTGYAANVGYWVKSTAVTATATHSGATVTIAPGAEVSLAPGANAIAVTVTAEDGATTIIYTVTVTRDHPPTASISAVAGAVAEGTDATFTVALDKAAHADLPVAVRVTESGAALAGTAPASVTIPQGRSSATLSVPTENDTETESDSTVTATLTAGTDYVVGAAAAASAVVEDDETRGTPTEPPAQMDPPSVQENGYFALSVRWNEPDPPDPRITGYDLQYRKTGAAAWTDGPQDRTGTSAEIGNLQGDTNYQVRVRAQNERFDGAWSEPTEAATALWIARLAVGAYNSEPRGRWGFVLDRTTGFGQLAPRVLRYGGVEYQPRVLVWTRGRRRIGGDFHNSTLDLFMVENAIPDQWILRVSARRYHTSEGFRSNPDGNDQVVIWPDPDLSLALEEEYDVVISREPSAPKDPNYDPGAPLTAEFQRLPTTHDGASPFRFRLRFSEEIELSSDDFGSDVFELTGGSVESARQLSPPSKASWEITVRPSGIGWVSIALAGNRDCATAGAVCTPLGKQLSGRIAAAVPGPEVTLLPGATIAAASSTVTEGTAASFTVTLPAAAGAALTLPVSVTETGSMLSGAPPVSVTFAQGDTTATLSVPTAADSVVEADSTVTATLPTGSGQSVSASATVEDDDVAAFTVSADEAVIDEGESTTLTVAISNGVTFAQDQELALTLSGTASLSDRTGVPAALTLPAGTSEVTATLAAAEDQEEEADETVTVTASRGDSPIGSTTVTINSISHDATLRALGLSGIDIGPFAGAVTTYQASVGPSVTSTTVTSTANHPAATVSIRPGSPVTLAEGANEITVTVTAEDGTTTNTYTVTVTRGGVPEATITAGTSPVTEGTAATFTVTLDQAAPEALTVTVSVTESGSVLSGTPPVSVSIAEDATTATLSVPTAGDKVVEADSTVTATLTAGTGYAIGSGASAAVTVEDDDAATFTVSADAAAISEGENATLTVAISNGVTFAGDQTISLATSGTASASDYTGVPPTLTLPAGGASVTATLTAATDADEDEQPETVTVTASHGGSAIGSATVTINSVSHDATLGTLSLTGIDIGTFSGTLTAYDASVSNAVAATTVTATAAHPAATVTIAPTSPVTLSEGANQIVITVTAEDGTTTKAYTVTVTREALPVATIAAGTTPVKEGAAATYTVTLDPAAPEALAVAVSVTESGAVVSGSSPVSVAFAKGATSATLSVPTAGDSVVEADSTVTATVTAGTGYAVGTAASAAVTVEDDDAATFAVSTDAEAIREGESATLTVAIANGVTFAEAQTISLVTSGTAAAADYTGVPPTLTLAAGGASVTATLTAATDAAEDEQPETVTVTASHGGAPIGSATVTIHSVSHNAALTALSLGGIDIGAFSSEKTSYEVNVDHSVETVTVTAAGGHSGATVTVEPGPEVQLAVGKNQIVIKVTAEDGRTTKTYTVTVTRAALAVVSIVTVEERVLGPIGEFRLSRTGPTEEPLAVQVLQASSRSGTSRPVTVRFGRREASVTGRVQAGDNRLVEDDITMTWTLQAGEDYTVSPERAAASLVLEESDIPEFAVTVEPAEIKEGESATVTVAIANGVQFARRQTIALAASGTASASDYAGLPETLTLAARSSSVSTTFAATADQEDERAETVTVTASHGGSAIGAATVTIGSVSSDATLSGLSLSGIDIGTFSGTLTAYQASVANSVTATKVTAAASHAGATVSINPGAEVSLAEGANEITVTVTAEDGRTTKTYTVSVTRAVLPVVTIAAGATPVAEGTAATFTASLDQAAPEALTVTVSVTESGAALSGTPPASVAFAQGATSATLSVPTATDSVVEADSAVTATVVAGTGYSVGAAGAASVTVEDDDAATFTVSAEPESIREGESATVAVAIASGVTFAEAQTISLGTSGTASAADYTGVPETLTLAAGASSVTATLAAATDQDEEEAETVTVTASHGGSSIGSATVTINSVSNDATLASLSLGGIDIGTFSDGTTGYQASVEHAVETATVTATPSHAGATVAIAPGAEVSLAVGTNAITVTVTAEDGTTTKTYTVTVTRAELALPVVSIVAVAERVSEGEPARFTVSRTGPATEELVVQLTAAASNTPQVTSTATRLRAGQSRRTVQTLIHDNTVVQDDITATWTIVGAAGYRVAEDAASATVVLEENDVAEFALAVEPAGVPAGLLAQLGLGSSGDLALAAADLAALPGVAASDDPAAVVASFLARLGVEAGAGPARVAEGAAATLTVRITNGVTFAEAQTIALEAAGGTATAGTDFALSSQSLTLPRKASATTARLLARNDDDDAEGDETVALTLRLAGEVVGTETVTLANRKLAVRFVKAPKAHDGRAAFAFELWFSKQAEVFSREAGIGDKARWDLALEVTQGSLTKARRLVPWSNLRWELTVQPASGADVALTLPVTTDCGAEGALCTEGGSRLSQRVSVTVAGPGEAEEGFPLAPQNSAPSGIWSDGETAWVADLDDSRLYAYRRSDGEREPERDIATEPGPMGLWSDGDTLWVAGLDGGLRAHRLADGVRLAGRDLALEANQAPAGVWSDGETAWVSAWLGDTVQAYRLSDGERVAGRDIRLAGENLMPAGVWSDGETLWVADWRERLFAYRLSDGERDRQREVAASGPDTDPTGLWSGGGTLLSTSWEGREVRAYRLPAAGEAAGAELPGRSPAGGVPMIGDPGLRLAIREALGKGPGEAVSAGELAGLESLSARNSGVRELSGLEAANGLKELDLGFNPLADLRPLAALPALESLNLDGSALDLGPLAALTGLRRLSVRHNRIDDLQALAALPSLTELDVGENRIEDLRPLAGLTRLAVLRADRNGIADLWPLAGLTELEVLELGANRVRDLQPLAGLERLEALRLAGNGLAELYPLSGLKGLAELGLAGNAVEELGALAGLEGLRRLDLRGNAAGDLRPLTGLPSLVWVHVGGSRIEDLAPLDGLDGLTVAGRDDLQPPSVGDGRGERSSHPRDPAAR